MKSDEGIFKMLSKSSIIRNQYENVIRPFWPFFNRKSYSKRYIRIIQTSSVKKKFAKISSFKEKK